MLVTLFMDYKGGTYVSQGEGESINAGVEAAINNQNFMAISALKGISKEVILKELFEDEFVSLKGLKNVYCGAAEINGALAIFHAVCTAT